MDNDIELSLETDTDDLRPEGERAAFALWVGECNGSMPCVEKQVQVTLRTLYNWQKRWQWKLERDVGLAEVTQLMQDKGKLGFQELLSDAALRLKKMLADDEADHREQRENIRLLASIAFAQQAEGPTTLIDARSVTLGSGANATPDDAMRRATGILEANVSSTNEERRRGRRKTF